MPSFNETRRQLSDAVRARAFPGAIVEVGRRDGAIWREPFGALSYEADAPAVAEDTVYDLASLTKVIATASLFMQLVEAGRIALDDRISRWLEDWTGQDRASVTFRDLLSHSAGITSWLPLFRDHRGRPDIERAICQLPLEAPPRTRAIYSDLGFMLLGFAIEDCGGSSLADQFDALTSRFLGATDVLLFKPPTVLANRIAPTEVDRWRGRLLVGEVHDENAWALGGAAGHAGLFGTASAVGQFARTVLAAVAGTASIECGLARADTLREFTTKSAVPGSSRALGMGHDAAVLVVRHSNVVRRLRPYGLYWHVALDRSADGPLRRAADQSGASVASQRSHSGCTPRGSRFGDRGTLRSRSCSC